MKKFKPLMLVLAGMAIAILVSFKLEEPPKEFALVNLGAVRTIIYYGNDKSKELVAPSHKNELVNQLNTLGKEGWSIKAETKEGIIFERVKQ